MLPNAGMFLHGHSAVDKGRDIGVASQCTAHTAHRAQCRLRGVPIRLTGVPIRRPHSPAASFACLAFFAPGMGSAPLQMHQLMATCGISHKRC